MKKFEEELDNLMCAYFEYRYCFDFDTEKYYLELKKDFIEKYGKKQQPEIPEVPQFVADWYEANKGSLDYMIFETCRDLTDESTDEFENWFGYDKNKAITTLVNMKNGYTVAKEKRFYLKNKFTGFYLTSVPESNDFYHISLRDPNSRGLVRSFTQKEIDSMETGSYEQIEVGE